MCICTFINSFYSSFNEYYNKFSYYLNCTNLRFFDYDILLSSLYHIVLFFDQHFDTSDISDTFISREEIKNISSDDLFLFVADFSNFIVNNFTELKNHLIYDTSLSTRLFSKICHDLLECVENLEDFYCFLKCKIENGDL